MARLGGSYAITRGVSMFNLVDDADFNKLKYRWDQQLAKGCPDIDERIVESLKQFNSINGVISIWSCSGHTKAEHLDNNGNVRTYTDRQERYIMFAANQQSTNLFHVLSEYMKQMDREDWALVRPNLHTSLLTWCFGKTDKSLELPEHPLRLYPCWRLSIHYNNLDSDPEMSKDIHMEMERIWLDMINYIVKESA